MNDFACRSVTHFAFIALSRLYTHRHKHNSIFTKASSFATRHASASTYSQLDVFLSRMCLCLVYTHNKQRGRVHIVCCVVLSGTHLSLFLYSLHVLPFVSLFLLLLFFSSSCRSMRTRTNKRRNQRWASNEWTNEPTNERASERASEE